MADDWNLALQAYREGDVKAAYAICNQLLDREPTHFGALNLMGALALKLGEPQQALILLDQALRLIPDQPDALVNRGLALYKLGLHTEAIAEYRRAVEHHPAYAYGWYNLGTLQKEVGEVPDAVESLRRCVELSPDYKAAHFNLANGLYLLKRLEESLIHFDRAVDIDPHDAEVRKNRSFARLMLGDYAGGLEDFEWRWATPPLQQTWRDRGCPQWSGRESLQHKAVLVHAEQGLGDTLQFCRYVRQLKLLGAAHVVFEVQKPLLHFMRCVAGVDLVVPTGLPLPEYDFHIPLMSLPKALGATLRTIPAPIPYLDVPDGRVEYWSEQIPKGSFNVGICWRGSAKGVEVGKGIPLSAFASIAACSGVRLFSLQKLDGESLPEAADVAVPVTTFGPSFDTDLPFADTAGVMVSLDLVITTDTSVAHLAGALGVPVWVALPYVCDWRWGPTSSTTPWYPTMRLFRQTTRGSWDSCFDQITQALLQDLLSRP